MAIPKNWFRKRIDSWLKKGIAEHRAYRNSDVLDEEEALRREQAAVKEGRMADARNEAEAREEYRGFRKWRTNRKKRLQKLRLWFLGKIRFGRGGK
ncbi:MAG: hypothetical protein PHD95_06035 [Candidatus ainarchaeum sp.]|nr:hypothetical protein [Candidatus ainarchaeum sp.]